MLGQGGGGTIALLGDPLGVAEPLREALPDGAGLSLTVVAVDSVRDAHRATSGADVSPLPPGTVGAVVPDGPTAEDGVALGAALRAAGVTVPIALYGESLAAQRVVAARQAGLSDVVDAASPESVALLAGTVHSYGTTMPLDGPAIAAQWGTIAGTLAHDIKNPLNVVLGRLDLLEVESPHVAAIDRSLDRIWGLVDDLSTLGSVYGVGPATDAVSLERQVHSRWQSLSSGDSTLVVDTDAEIQAHPGRLNAILDRVLENAVHHSDGPVTVTVSETAAGFAIDDDGPGIPAADRERVFEQGYSLADQHEGYGLFVARVAASAMGWTISADASGSGGTRIAVATRDGHDGR